MVSKEIYITFFISKRLLIFSFVRRVKCKIMVLFTKYFQNKSNLYAKNILISDFCKKKIKNSVSNEN